MGIEWREEDFTEDRDPRSDGSVQFIDQVTGEWLNLSDIVGSSASPDASGSRHVTSLFAEFLVPRGPRPARWPRASMSSSLFGMRTSPTWGV